MDFYSVTIEKLEEGTGFIEFKFKEKEEIYHVEFSSLNLMEPKLISQCDAPDEILFKLEIENRKLIVYVISGNLVALLKDSTLRPQFEANLYSYNIKFESKTEYLIFKQTDEVSFSVFTEEEEFLFTVDDLVSGTQQEYLCSADFHIETVEYRFLYLGVVRYSSYHLFFTYDLFRKEVTTKKVVFAVLANDADLTYKLLNPQELELSSESYSRIVTFNKIGSKGKKVFEFYELEDQRELHLLGDFLINGKRFFLHNKTGGVFLTRGNAGKVTGYRSHLYSRFWGDFLYIFGRSTHYAYKANTLYDYLYVQGSHIPIGKFKRPINIRLLNRYGFFKIPVNSLVLKNGKETVFYLGNDKQIVHKLRLRTNQAKSKILDFKVRNDHVVVLKSDSKGNATANVVSESPEYAPWKRNFLFLKNFRNSNSMLKIFRLVFLTMGLLPKRKKLVVFESFHAKQFSDNPRALYEYMKENHNDYQLLWSIDKSSEQLFKLFEVPYVCRFTFRWFLTFPRAKYWINNVRLPKWMPKPEGTVYLQTWHGTPLKKLGLDIEEIHMPGTNTSAYKRNFISESAKWDYLISPNPYSTEIFKRAFHYKGRIIESGYPRNDILTDYTNSMIQEIKRKLNISVEKKVMLYAPTWRDSEFYQKGKYRFEFQFNLDKWREEFGNEWVLLSRMHYLVAENFDFSLYQDIVYDVSAYPDIRDLYLVSDLLITDYSSVFFDYSILNRPIIFFMYDLEKYRDQLRGFYMDIEKDAPGPIVQTEEELFKAMKEMPLSNVLLNSNFIEFKQRFSSLEDGFASKRVIETLLIDK